MSFLSEGEEEEKFCFVSISIMMLDTYSFDTMYSLDFTALIFIRSILLSVDWHHFITCGYVCMHTLERV